MAARYYSELVKFLLCCLAVCLTARAQGPVQVDRKGCSESKVVSRMPGCFILQCNYLDYASAPMPRTKGERNHQVEGKLEKTVYRCPKEKSPLELGRNTEAALKNAGFQILYTDVYAGGARFYMTAQRGGQWVNLSVVSDSYDLTAVTQKEMEQVMTANAEGWAEQVNRAGRVTVYGINFDTGRAILRTDSEAVLNEVAKMLQANPSWAMLVAGHTDDVGAREMNVTLSRQRAESVIAWLAARGVDKTRLVAAGFGDTRPLAANKDEEGRQKNRRVDLVKLY
jgi:outer membrane protein OmpA-like peptidoglycan-associated protein